MSYSLIMLLFSEIKEKM